MKYNDQLNKEDYQVYSIFEFPNDHFQCAKCCEILPNTEAYVLPKVGIRTRCKECHKFERKCHHYKNPNLAVENDRKWQKRNRQYLNKHRVERRKKDPLFNMRERLISRIANALKFKNWKKNDSITKSIGCDPEFLCKYIESKFLPGMTWENRHLWHLDHRIPLSSAKNEADLLKLNHYTNLQPLWTKDNLKKSNKL